MRFGNLDKKDFFMPPFAVFYFYIVFANSFHLPYRKHARILPH